MALLSQQLQRFLLTGLSHESNVRCANRATVSVGKSRSRCCSAIAIDAPSSLTGVSGIRWGYTSLQGPREEMEDDVVLRSDGLDGFSFAAVFDGHGGSASVKFLRDELFKECAIALQGGLILSKKEINSIKDALEEAFANADAKLLNWLESMTEEDESGSTATVLFMAKDTLFISHVGDSSVVLSRSGKPEVLTNPHRPYGSNKISLDEIRRIREAGGWIVNGRICGDISVSRAFGDIRYKTKKNEEDKLWDFGAEHSPSSFFRYKHFHKPSKRDLKMLKKGVDEGRWPEKFISRIKFNGDLVIPSPDVYSLSLGSDTEFVILASDGLWDYMSSSDAVDFIRNQLRQHGDVQLASEALAQAALDRRTQDNVSIVIADLGRTDWQNLPVQRQNVFLELAQALATVGIVSVGVWMTSLLGA